MKHLKHLFTALLLLCTTVVTAHDFEVGGIYYKIIDETNKTVAVTYQGASPDSYFGEYTGEISIPETVVYDGEIFRVVSIGEGAFFACQVLRIVIPNSVTNIEYGAFFNCQRLGSITIPNGVTSIGNSAFKGCTSLKEVCFEDGDSILSLGVNSYNKDGLGGGLFENCPLEVLHLGRDLSYYIEKSCGYSPFYNRSRLKTVTIGNGVTRIGEYAFVGCSGLESIAISSSVIDIGYYAFLGCNELDSVTIPSSVKRIEYGAFLDCSKLKSITIPSNVVSIGNCAFSGCTSLKEVCFEDGDSTLCLGSNNDNRGGDLFKDCPLGALYLGRDLSYNTDKSYGYSPFYNKKTIETLIIGNSVTSIGYQAFKDCSRLNYVEIGNSVASIGEEAFHGCSALGVVFNFSNLTFTEASSDNGGVAYNANCVYNMPKGSIEGDFVFAKPNGVNTLCLYFGNAKDLTLPADYNGENYAIGNKAFYNRTGLTSITIPNSVASIGDMAFKGCSSLKKVCFEDGDSTLSLGYNTYNNSYSTGKGLFYDCPLETLYLGRDLSYNTDASCGYSPFYNKNELKTVTIGNSVTSIGAASFSNCHALTSIKIPNSVTSIGSSAFSWCSGLTSIEIPNSVTSIGHFAFNGCTNLTNVKIEEGVKSIGQEAFAGCSYLKSIIIPNSVSSIGDGLFSDCNKSMQIINFSSVELTGNHNVINAPNGYIEGEFVYADINEVKTLCGCTVDKFSFDGLEYTINKGNFGTVTIIGASNEISGDLIIPDSVIYSGVSFKVSSINENVFFNRTGLTSITIPNSVTYIGNGAFCRCHGLTSVVIGNSVTSIGNNAFYNCWGLTSVTIPNSVTSIGKGAFEGCSELTSIEIPNSVTSIEDEAFYGCAGLTSIEIPNSVTSLGFGAFKNCRSLTSVKIGNGVTRIGSYAFVGCSGLTKVTMGSNVSTISSSAFEGCDAIANVYIRNLAAWCNIDFYSSDANPLHSGARLLVNNAPLTSFVTPKGITEIKKYAFFGCKGLTSVNISGSVNNVGYSAFNSCADLKTITLSNKIEELCEYAFANCEKIGSVTIKRIIKDGFIKCDHNTFDKVTYTKATLYAHPSDWRTYYNAYGWGWYRFIKVVKRQ